MVQWQIGHNGGGVGQAWLYIGDAHGDAGGPGASDEHAPGVTIMAADVGDIPDEAGGRHHCGAGPPPARSRVMTVEPTPHDDAVRVLRAAGELDACAVSPMLPRPVALVAGAQGLNLDLTAVTFFDSSGVRLVDQLARECGRTGAPFRVVSPPDTSSRRVLELVGLAALIVSDDLPTELTSLRHWPTTQAVPDGPRTKRDLNAR